MSDHTVSLWTLPPSYAGRTWEGYYSSGFGRSRDSDALERANFATVTDALTRTGADEWFACPRCNGKGKVPCGCSACVDGLPSRCAYGCEHRCRDCDGTGQTPAAQVVRESHWAVGWVEWIAIHPSATTALARARKLCERANDYPILDEDLLSDYERGEQEDTWINMRLRDRIALCARFDVSIFAARRPYPPSTDTGGLEDYLLSR